MPRNASGIYAPPPGTQVLPNTLADAGKVETRLSDIGAEISASMPLSGLRPMQAPLLSVAGSAAAPGFAFSGDSSSGLASISGRTALVKGGVSGLSTSAADVQAHVPMTVGQLTVGTLTVQNGASGPGVVPTGTVVDFAGSNAPAGWLLCNGQAVSRTTYADLFAVIGGYYGAGNGSTTFNVPDYRGRIGVGLDTMGGADAGRMVSQGAARHSLGWASGADVHALTGAENGPHQHGGVTDVGGGHQHAVSGVLASVGGPYTTPPFGSGINSANIATGWAGEHQHSFTTGWSGSGAGHNNVQPSIYVFKIIRT